MADVWLAAVKWDGVTVTSPTRDATQFGTRPAIFLSAHDGNEEWAIEARLAWNEYDPGGGPVWEAQTQFFFYFNVGVNDPGLGSLVAGTSSILEADGQNGAAFLAGGTISIEKDSNLDRLRFSTPLGTVDKTLSAFSANDNTPLRINAMAHQFVRPEFNADGDATEKWYDFYSSMNGTPFRGTAMSSTDPGAWSGWTDVTFGFPSGAIAVSDNDQEPTRYRTKFRYTHATDSPRSLGSRQWRTWTGGDTINASGDTVTDMIQAQEHGAHWAVYSYPVSADTLTARRSFDRGASWEERTVYSATGTGNRSPSIQWHGGRLIAVWHNGTDILQAFSHTLGWTWETAMALSITGTNPRLLVDPRSGLAFYFYVDAGTIKLVRSGDFGASFVDATPITVATGVGSQTPAAQFGMDGSIIVGFILSNAWEQRRSNDLGKSWV